MSKQPEQINQQEAKSNEEDWYVLRPNVVRPSPTLSLKGFHALAVIPINNAFESLSGSKLTSLLIDKAEITGTC